MLRKQNESEIDSTGDTGAMFLQLLRRLSFAFVTLAFMTGAAASAASAQAAVYDAVPSPLAPNYASLGFQATSTREVGDYVSLAGNERLAQSVKVTMSAWGLQSTPSNMAYCTANPGVCDTMGWNHPFTINFHSIGAGTVGTRGVGTLIGSVTQSKFVPWRPEADPTCPSPTAWRFDATTCYNGLAFTLEFDVSSMNAVLPDDVIVSIAYNTQTHGYSPMGVGGPFDSLNVAVGPGPAAVGTDESGDRIFWNTTHAPFYTDGGAAGVGILREDTGWSTLGTLLFQITASPVTSVVDDDGMASATNCNASDPAPTSISAAYAAANPGDTVLVCPGTYTLASTVNLNKANTTIIGAEATRPVVQAASAIGQAFFVTANGVRIENIELQKTDLPNQNLIGVQGNDFTAQNNFIYGPNPGMTWNAAGIVSRGFVISANSNINLIGNTIQHLRQPAYMSGNATTGGTISGNNVSGTKGWVVEGGDFTFTGNTWGEPQNQDCDIALLANVATNNAAFYLPLLDLSMANDNAFICQQYGASENGRAVAYVNSAAGSGGNGSDNANYTSINTAIAGTLIGGTVDVAGGTYSEDVVVNKTVMVRGAGAESTTVAGPIGGGGATFQIGASNVELSGFTITRAGNNTTDWNDPNLNFAGITIQGQALSGTLIRDNMITGSRTGFDINNSNGHTIRNNVFDNNHTGLIFRNQTDNITFTENTVTNNRTVGVLFLDASGGTNVPVQTAAGSNFTNNNFSGNWYGGIVDRQSGGSLPAPGTTNLKNFSGNWYGTNAPVVTTANSAEPGYPALIPVVFGGTATAPGGQPDIAGPASANFDYTPFLNAGVDINIETVLGRGTNGFQGDFGALNISAASAQVGPLSKIQEAIDLITAGGSLSVPTGNYPGNVDVNKPLSINGTFTVGGSFTTSSAGVTLSPGYSPGIITTGNLTFGTGTTVNLELNGIIPGVDHDQFDVTGTVTIDTGVNLNVIVGGVPSPGGTYTIINNDLADAVSGTFAGRPEGSTILAGGYPFIISYVGGDGNDVVLSYDDSCDISVNTPVMTAMNNDSVSIPVNTSLLTGEGVVAADFTFNYNTSVLSPAGITVTRGPVVPDSGHAITVNTSTPGSVVVSVLNGSMGGEFTGAGVLVNINMTVIGSPGSTTPLTLTNFRYNGGTVCSMSTSGSLSVLSGTISGRVGYHQAPIAKSVSNVLLNAPGSPSVSDTTDGSGLYSMTGFGPASYTVTPSRTAYPFGMMGANGIFSLDSSKIAQHVVGLIVLSPEGVEAGKVSGLPTLSSFDAALIAQWIVGITNPINQTGQWKFVPVNRFYANVNSDHINQDYTGVLMGDVDNDWNPAGARPAPVLTDPERIRNAVKTSVASVTAQPGEAVTVPVSIENLKGEGVTSYQFDIAYDANVLAPAEVSADLTGTIGEGLSVAFNTPEKGILKVAVYGAAPVTGDGVFVNLRFMTVGAGGSSSPLTISQFRFNNGDADVVTIDGKVRVLASDREGESISGRLLSAFGEPVADTRVVLTSTTGNRVFTTADADGYFEFIGLTAGETYTVSVASKRFPFAPRTVSVTSGVTQLNMIAEQ